MSQESAASEGLSPDPEARHPRGWGVTYRPIPPHLMKCHLNSKAKFSDSSPRFGFDETETCSMDRHPQNSPFLNVFTIWVSQGHDILY